MRLYRSKVSGVHLMSMSFINEGWVGSTMAGPSLQSFTIARGWWGRYEERLRQTGFRAGDHLRDEIRVMIKLEMKLPQSSNQYVVDLPTMFIWTGQMLANHRANQMHISGRTARSVDMEPK